MTKRKRVNVSLLGLGVVGTELARALNERSASAPGCGLALRRALVRDPGRARALDLPPGVLTSTPEEVLEDPEADIAVEVMGGERPAADYLRRAIRAGKHVVTANKEVMAKSGPELLELAGRSGVHLRFEASVGAGIPIVGPLQRDLKANRVRTLHGIVNGTTNYVLTRMAAEGAGFEQALRDAQQRGYAEPDPTSDVEAIDPAFKLAILASLAYHTRLGPGEVYREGIGRLRPQDFRYASELGYAIKLLAIAVRDPEGLQARVHPTMIPQDALLASVNGEFNAVEVEGDLSGPVLFYGRGAGPRPTASAVLGDVLEIASAIERGAPPESTIPPDEPLPARPVSELVTRYYLRVTVTDAAGVLAKIGRVMADHRISLASVIQKRADPERGTAEIVVTTHPSRESDMQGAVEAMRSLDVVWEIGNLVRIERLAG